jgi:hypothetical protein
MKKSKKLADIFSEIVEDNRGIYPKSFGNVLRTKWQEGWNAQLMDEDFDSLSSEGKRGWQAAFDEGIEYHKRLDKWWEELDPSIREVIEPLVIEEKLVINIDTEITYYVDCSDFFWWGCADGEDVLEEDLPALLQALKDSPKNGELLYCARKRGVRPQGAYYKYLEGDEELFNACGVDREIDFCNPKDQQGVYKYSIKRWWQFWK